MDKLLHARQGNIFFLMSVRVKGIKCKLNETKKLKTLKN